MLLMMFAMSEPDIFAAINASFFILCVVVHAPRSDTVCPRPLEGVIQSAQDPLKEPGHDTVCQSPLKE